MRYVPTHVIVQTSVVVINDPRTSNPSVGRDIPLENSRIIVILLLAAMTLLLANCQRLMTLAANVPGFFGAFERHADISYGPNVRSRLDVYSPHQAEHRAVVIFWHGGLWVEGSRTQYRFVGAALARAGYVAVLPDYRLYPEVKFPEFVQDGASAVRWVHDEIAEYGGDPQAIFVMGHSAGAHIAAMLALDSQYLQAVGGSPQWIRGLIGLSGPYAIETGESPTSVGVCAARVGCKRLLSAIFSAPYSSQDWQPMPAKSSDPPPALLFHGAQDPFVVVRHAEVLRDRLAERRGHVELHVYPEGDHTDTLIALSIPSKSGFPVLDNILDFISTHSPERRVEPP